MSQVQGHESAPVEVKDPLTADERAELERLRQENSTLRAREPRPRRKIRWRSVVAAVLIVLGCALAPVSLLAVWTHNEVSDTDHFVETVGPLVGDPAVQEAVTNRVTTTVFQYIDVEGLAKEAIAALAAQGLPPRIVDRLNTFTPTLQSAATSFVRDKVGELVASPQFASAWNQAVRIAHQQAVTVLSGDSQSIVIQGGMVQLDLAPFIDAAKQRLSAAGLDGRRSHPRGAPDDRDRARRPAGARAVGLPRPGHHRLRAAVDHAAAAGRRRLPGAAAEPGDRRRVPRRRTGSGPARRGVARGTRPARRGRPDDGGCGSGLGVRHHRAVPPRLRQWVLLVLALVIALGAFLVGPSPTAVGVRGWASGLLNKIRGGPSATGPVGTWVRAHLRGLRIGAVALAALVFVFLQQPSGVAILIIAAVLLVVLGVIEFLARPGPEPVDAPVDPPVDPPVDAAEPAG